MKLIVVSDIHGKGQKLLRILELHPRYDALVFLGDGIRDIEGISDGVENIYAVRGNCDTFSFFNASNMPLTEELFFSVEEYNILMMHGHRFGVKHGIEAAAEYAARRGADILLYGHTHVPYEQYISDGERIGDITLSKPLRIFNPGSLGDRESSYGIIEIKNGSVLMSHGTV